MAAKDSKVNLLEHSQAKVGFYQRYLSIYLEILHRAPYTQKIYILDLMCGEGIYENGGKGSPIITIETIRDHYFLNSNKCKDIEVWFNDFEKSSIEKNKFKVKRVEESVKQIFTPENVEIKYFKKEYNEIIKNVKKLVNYINSSEKVLIFIDPWGYKDINPDDFLDIMRNKGIEIILFLPLYFMYRVATYALEVNTPQTKALEIFLRKLYQTELPAFKDCYQFIDELIICFKRALEVPYISSYIIERSKGNFFCLFFFTRNKTGFYAMLKSKWDLDNENGRIFKLNKTLDMFADVSFSKYPDLVENYLRTGPKTNRDLFDFGLDNNYLPKHTNMILNELINNNKVERKSLDDKQVKGNYLDDDQRTIIFRIIKR